MDEILVLDFGSQYNQLIARRIREMGIFSELVPYDITKEEILKREGLKGIILSGGPHSVHDKDMFKPCDEIFDLGVPVLGICYGMQFMSHHFGGRVEALKSREYGGKKVKVHNDSVIFKGTPKEQMVWMSHGDGVIKLAPGFTCVASTEECENAAIECVEKNLYGIQYHPEVNNSEYGFQQIENFCVEICHAQKLWNMDRYIEEQLVKIKETVGDKRVLLGISGGVDSTVAAVLIHRAIGDQLTCMFIDHGLLRKNEADIVMERFDRFGIKVTKIDASKLFLGLLKDVKEPEKKRKIIGNTFVKVFDEESAKLGDFAFLAQGTLYTDVIESGTKTAQTIKSHHNVGGLPEDMRFKLLEPLNKLFKDEVRNLGRALGIDEELVARQPFPGPGLAIRVIGDITEDKLRIVRDTDQILRDEVKNHGLQNSIWQYFTVLLDCRSVGVMGDQRSYSYIVAIRAVTSIDGMTADWAKIPYDVLDVISRRIVNEVNGVNRVVYDVTSKPPSTIEFE